MATIVNSFIAQDRVQADGRRKIVELHTDDAGTEHRASYLAESGDDVDVILAAHAAAIVSNLAAREGQRLDNVRFASAAEKVRAWMERENLFAAPPRGPGLTQDEARVFAARKPGDVL